MKEIIKHYFPFILTVLCAVCALSIFFYGFTDSQNGIFTDIGTYFSNETQKNHLTAVASQVEALEKAPLPTLIYNGNTLLVGEPHTWNELFTLHFSDGTISKLEEQATAALYLIDVAVSDGSSVLTRLSSAEIDSLEELPSAAIYDIEKQLLYFHKSGIYTLRIRFYFDYRPGVLFECQVPVEVR